MAAPLPRVTISPEPLASLSSSPVEEDIGSGGSGAWHDHDESTSTSGSTLADHGVSSSRNKGKGRDTGSRRSTTSTGRPYRDADESSEDEPDAVEGYPPTKDDEAESRRVEENLRRWEMAERQRRKAARESQLSTATNTSVVSDATRKASSLWPNRRNKRPSMDGAGSHHILHESNDDGVPLDEFDNRLAPSPGPDQSLNPFATPNISTTSLNTPYDSAVMTASNVAPDDLESSRHASRRRTLDAASKGHPPPAPLDLPQPRSPPPRTTTPHANRPPEPTPPPAPIASPMPDVEDVPHQKTRWFTDWLCGCVERDDHQAGRTNPFE